MSLRVAARRGLERPARPPDRVGWLEQTVGGITASVEHAVFTEQHARQRGFLQDRDPRAKLGMFLVVLLAASLTGSLAVLAGLHLVVLGTAHASGVPARYFVRRVWLGIPLFAGLVTLPALFLVPGPRLVDLPIGPLHVALSVPGIASSVTLVARVGVDVSLAVLLVLTTPWADILKSLRALGVPQVFVLVLSMTYRYIFLFLHTANGVLLARRSRTVGRTSGSEQRRWIGGTLGSLVGRAFRLSNEVYAAMLARGFGGEIRVYSAYRMRAMDWVSLGASLVVAISGVLAGQVVA